jgi:hypothetical protein
MKSRLVLLFTPLLIVLIVSCNGTNRIETKEFSEIEKWKLGWRLIDSSWNKNFELAELQFDSLLEMEGRIETKFLVTGLDVLAELGKKEKIVIVLGKQDQLTLEEICNKELLTKKLPDIQICKSIVKDEIVGDKALQIELIKMYINDQSVRGNVLSEMISKYKLGEYELATPGVSVDGMNRVRLKEIIMEFGFPTRQLVGRDAMQGVFFLIQHSDGDREWQKEQLPNIEKAVKQGDMDGQAYGYLYDRIKINGGEKQLYGTQFKNVDVINKRVELADTEDIGNLDRRRMEVGMMPIKMYEQFMLKSIPN